MPKIHLPAANATAMPDPIRISFFLPLSLTLSVQPFPALFPIAADALILMSLGLAEPAQRVVNVRLIRGH